MKSSKLLLSVLVVILILSFTITSVGANTELPPVGERDEDGDLVVDVLQPLKLDQVGDLPDVNLWNFTADEVQSQEVEPAAVAPPTPLYPIHNTTTLEKYPRYSFTEVVGATRYHVQVYNTFPEPDVLVYSIKGDGGDCSCGCNLYPTLPLKPWDILLKNGFYQWHVRAKVAGEWSDWSAFSFFVVLKNRLNTSFDAPTNVWAPIYGTWVLTDTGFAKTAGELHMLSSVINKFVYTEKFVYEVMMKRKNTIDNNYVYFQAWPNPLSGANFWDDGYLLTYSNNGDWALFRVQDSSYFSIAGGTTSNIIPYGWNKITIMRETSLIKIFINEHYLGAYSDDTFSVGAIGFGMYKAEDVRSPLLVDWARVEYTDIDPYAVP